MALRQSRPTSKLKDIAQAYTRSSALLNKRIIYFHLTCGLTINRFDVPLLVLKPPIQRAQSMLVPTRLVRTSSWARANMLPIRRAAGTCWRTNWRTRFSSEDCSATRAIYV